MSSGMKISQTNKRTAMEWERFFISANVRVEALGACKSTRSKAIKIGQFFAMSLGREVPIEVSGRTGKAVLKVISKRAKEKRYYFEITWDDSVAPEKTRGGSREDDKNSKTKLAKKETRNPEKPEKKRRATTESSRHKTPRSKASDGLSLGNDEAW